jgi:hypothetical protein
VSLEVDQFDNVIKNLRAKGLNALGETDNEILKPAFVHSHGNLGILRNYRESKGGWIR